jgi:lon-related putative ATP-dependent protease
MPDRSTLGAGSTRLEPTELDRPCDPALLGFETTAELENLDGTLGQQRALSAVRFAVGMRGSGYNLFVHASPGSHQHRIVREFLESQPVSREPPSDWVYVNNFEDARKPAAIRLPAGQATAFAHDMAQLVEELQTGIPAAFEGESYRNRVFEINHEFEERLRAHLEALEQEARQDDITLAPTPHGFGLAPLRNGRALTDEEFGRLPPVRQQHIREAMERVSEKLRRHLEQLPQWHKERRERIKAFNRGVTDSAVAAPIERLKARYVALPGVCRHLDAMREDVLVNAQDFPPVDRDPATIDIPRAAFDRYQVNVLVAHTADQAAPIAYERHPSVQNLLGRVEHVAQNGVLVTDFSMIRPGALHRANGGYLMLDADRLLLEPLAWPALKRALYAGEIRIESLAELLSMVSTVKLEPDSLPLDVKVILLGDRLVYYLLCAYDSDFGELFKVGADFEDRLDRNPANTALYGRMLAALVQREALLPFSSEAIARVIEHSARLVGDAEKLTMRVRQPADLLRESDYWARETGCELVGAEHVQRAIDARIQRADRLRSEIRDETLRNDILIATSGACVGQVNGLSVVALGEFAFGHPVRITATVRMGEGKIIDIEREAELAGPIHSKAVMILSSYLGAKYAPDSPLSLRASVVFEQSYAGVEGDSASLAETCALLSALADAPILQSFAVTGSVNQHGELQVIGGVNEKIEGFFDLCMKRGPDGSHGVLIPRDNVKHLMLRADVVEAVGSGQFNVYGVETVDDAIALLTGHPAGIRNADGQFPTASINRRIEERLARFAAARLRFDRRMSNDTTRANPEP